MKKKIKISEPERLANFMHSFDPNHSDDFKALVLHLIGQSDIETVSKQVGLPTSTLDDWQSGWNKKKSGLKNHQGQGGGCKPRLTQALSCA